jgi:hypothetical protein
LGLTPGNFRVHHIFIVSIHSVDNHVLHAGHILAADVVISLPERE